MSRDFLSSAASEIGIGRPFALDAASGRESSQFAGRGKRRFMKARQFDEKFDAGEDVSGEIDWEKARRPNLALKRVNVDFPAWVIEALDREARRLGVTRQALVKLWIAERLDRAA